ncbi:hypothetical protein EV702DRAFT_1201633 [Suillus placidus]|uniref:Uncharacterized protein n=1 Tax=Suillus placidus TaxID=48579 RepID=A0A9P7CZ98_9AGAM|nr:hypothetical protein EV702DRAFT_1201633 [Suillus placidus]
MSWNASVLSSVSSDTEPTVVITFDSAKYIFKSRRNWKKTRGVFLTLVGTQVASGLPSLLMTFADLGLTSLNIARPARPLHFMAAMHLRDLTFHTAIWHDAYKHAKFPRPLGPLDSTLSLASSWKTPLSSWRPLMALKYCRSKARLLRQRTEDAIVIESAPSASFSHKLLSVRFSSDGPLLELSMVIPGNIIGGMGMSQLSARKRLLCISDHLTGTLNLAVDTRARVPYRFPPPSSIIDPNFATTCTQETYLKRLVATETHILAMFTPITIASQLDEGGNCRAIIQAFALPSAGHTTTSSPTIQLTHEGHRYLEIERVSLLCDSMTNAVTGQTQIKFLTHCMRLNLTKCFAHRVTLSPPLPGQKLGNIYLSTEQLFSVPGDGTEFYGFTIDSSGMDEPYSGIVGLGVDIKEVEATESFPSSLRMTWNVKLAFDGYLG